MRAFTRDRLFIISLILCLGLAPILGCGANSKQIQDSTIVIVGQNAGYYVYRFVPEARAPLAAICLISDFSNPDAIAAKLKELLGEIWMDADKLTTQDARQALILINSLVELLNINLANEKAERAKEILKLVIANVCKGVGAQAPVV